MENNKSKNIYDTSVINRAFCMVEDAVKIIEDMDLEIETIISALGLSIYIYDNTKINNDNQIKAKIYFDETTASIYNFAELNKTELKAEAIILCLLYQSMNKAGIKDFDEKINDEEFVKKIKSRVGALVSRLIIPKKEFNDELGEIIYNTYYNEQIREEQLLALSLIRKLLIEKLMKKYNVTENMANIRLSVADLGDNKYDSLGQSAIYDFKHSYFDSEDAKVASKSKK